MDLRIFLSSTFVDLRGAREAVIRLLSVIPADFIAMEVFGSDEAQPLDFCLEQVHRSNFFIGIYAERYGNIDPITGKSITQLEYEEATRLLATGQLLGLLIYVLDHSALWPVEYIDRDARNVSALEAFKSELKNRHTVSFFKDAEGLPLLVLRDLLRKIGVGPERALRIRPPRHRTSGPARPVLGMEHFTDRETALLRGREVEVQELCALVESEPITLLIGESGIGKSSLIEAGVAPVLRKRGWTVVLSRPLGSDIDLTKAIWTQTMEGLPGSDRLFDCTELISSAFQEKNLCIVIDQFEDALAFKDFDLQSWAAQLAQVRSSALPNLRILISYRGDSEPQFGKIWQRISRSREGLPRFYLTSMTHRGAVEALLSSLAASGVETESSDVIDAMVTDIRSESRQNLQMEVFPPFIQIVLVSVVAIAKRRGQALSRELYESLGRTESIIGRFLMDQLEHLGTFKKASIEILPTLVSSKRKVSRTADFIANQTGLDATTVDDVLHRLMDLRLVRHVEDKWELVHDYLAESISKEIVAPEESDATIIRDVLYAKAAAYPRTQELLTPKEIIGIYCNRHLIRYGAPELELLCDSSRNGPIHYFFKSVSQETRQYWQETHSLWMKEEDPIIRLRECGKWEDQLPFGPRLFQRPKDLLSAFRVNEVELSEAALQSALKLDIDKQRELVDILLRSRTSKDLRLLFKVVGSRHGEEWNPDELAAKTMSERLLAYAKSTNKLDSANADYMFRNLSNCQSEREKEACAFALADWAQRVRQKKLLEDLLKSDIPTCRAVLLSLDGDRGDIDLSLILAQFEHCPYETAAAVWRTAHEMDWLAIARFLKRTPLSDHVRSIILALPKLKEVKSLPFLLELIREAGHKVDLGKLWTIELSLCSTVEPEFKAFLERVIKSREYWEFVNPKLEEGHIEISLRENLYVYKRLIGAAFARLAGPSDWSLLRDLAFHSYFPVRNAAIGSILRFAGERELNDIAQQAKAKIEETGSYDARERGGSRFMSVVAALDQRLYCDWTL